MSTQVVVVGSANLDIVVPVPHHAGQGETVLGGDHRLVPGGKGANQAVAAARLGRSVAFVGLVGSDDAGATLLGSLRAAGVDVSAVGRDRGPSGIALITVDAEGDNAIVVSPGANGRLSVADVEKHAALLAEARVMLVQLEIPLDAVAAAVGLAGGTVILNPAPAAALPRAVLDRVTVLVPNRGELALLAGADLDPSRDGVAEALGVPAVVTTLGSAGAAVARRGEATVVVPAPAVTPVDTTAAGDSFCAALADGLCGGLDLVAAVEWAVRVGAATTLRSGAQPSLPTVAEVAELIP